MNEVLYHSLFGGLLRLKSFDTYLEVVVSLFLNSIWEE